MASIIQLPSDETFFDLQVLLDGVTYTLEFRWNTRALAWFMSIYDETLRTLLRAGVRVVADWPLAFHHATRTPPGILYAYDTTQQGIDPGLTDLGDRVQLFYFTEAEAKIMLGG